MPGRVLQLGILSFWSDVERPRWGWRVQVPGYISARLLLTPASLLNDVVQLASAGRHEEAVKANINEQLGRRRRN